MKKWLLALIVCSPCYLFAQRIILHCGRLIDVKQGQILREYSIIVENNK